MGLALPRERMWAKFRRDENGCWIWTAMTDRNGYARCNIGPPLRPLSTHSLAHRTMYELLVGPIPGGLFLDHLCRVHACVNPMHLEPVTNGENIRRGVAGALKTHCANGHAWVPENIKQRPNGSRYCYVCHLEKQRERYAARTAS